MPTINASPCEQDLKKIGVGLGICPDFNSGTWDTTEKSAEHSWGRKN